MDIYTRLLNGGKQIAHQSKVLSDMLSNISASEGWQQNLAMSKTLSLPSDKVMLMAFHSENFAAAFNVGYQFALRYLFARQIAGDELACLCVSEQGGSSPKLMKSHLFNEQDKSFVSGEKTFVTCADKVDTLLLLLEDKRHSTPTENKLLRILPLYQVQHTVKEKAAGFTLQVSEAGKFVPEIRKGRLKLEKFQVNADKLLEHDGHGYYSRPFSVLEGLFIRLANVSFLLKWSFYFRWPQSLKADLLAQVVMLKQIIDGDPLTAQAQIVLDSQARLLEQCLLQIESLLPQCPQAFQEHWQRDKLVLFMDVQFRKQRLEKAWAEYE